MKERVIIYRRTATASTYLMRSLSGVYATTPIDGIDLSRRCFNTEYELVIKYLLEQLEGPLVVVNLVRNPFTRFVSQFFKNISNERIRDPVTAEFVENPFHVTGEPSFEKLQATFRRAMDSFLIPNDFGIERSYPRLFGVNLEDYSFDYDRLNLYFESGRFRFLTLRSEDIRQWSSIVRKTLGWKIRFGRKRVNAGEDKQYARLYADFLDQHRYTPGEVERIRALATSRKYYVDGSR